MNKMEKRALLGLHGKRDLVIGLRELFQNKGYSVDVARELDEMQGYVKGKSYDLYLMDLNLGSSGSPNIAPAIQVYDLIKERVESGQAKFFGISGNSDAVKSARERGIPASDLLDFDNLFY